jgi:hypothetical protein
LPTDYNIDDPFPQSDGKKTSHPTKTNNCLTLDEITNKLRNDRQISSEFVDNKKIYKVTTTHKKTTREWTYSSLVCLNDAEIFDDPDLIRVSNKISNLNSLKTEEEKWNSFIAKAAKIHSDKCNAVIKKIPLQNTIKQYKNILFITFIVVVLGVTAFLILCRYSSTATNNICRYSSTKIDNQSKVNIPHGPARSPIMTPPTKIELVALDNMNFIASALDDNGKRKLYLVNKYAKSFPAIIGLSRNEDVDNPTISQDNNIVVFTRGDKNICVGDYKKNSIDCRYEGKTPSLASDGTSVVYVDLNDQSTLVILQLNNGSTAVTRELPGITNIRYPVFLNDNQTIVCSVQKKESGSWEIVQYNYAAQEPFKTLTSSFRQLPHFLRASSVQNIILYTTETSVYSLAIDNCHGANACVPKELLRDDKIRFPTFSKMEDKMYAIFDNNKIISYEITINDNHSIALSSRTEIGPLNSPKHIISLK